MRRGYEIISKLQALAIRGKSSRLAGWPEFYDANGWQADWLDTELLSGYSQAEAARQMRLLLTLDVLERFTFRLETGDEPWAVRN